MVLQVMINKSPVALIKISFATLVLSVSVSSVALADSSSNWKTDVYKGDASLSTQDATAADKYYREALKLARMSASAEAIAIYLK